MKIVGVVGFGTMGAGIAQIAILSGYACCVLEPNDEQRSRGFGVIQKGLEKLIEKGKLTPENRDAALARLLPVSAAVDLAACDIVIEAIPEKLELKQQLFADLEAICPPECVLGTNTSSLSVTAIATLTKHPERVIGLHFFNPVPLMRLVEVIPGLNTSEEVKARSLEWIHTLGKTPVLAKDTPGFIVNRVARPFYGEALRLLGEGVATVEEIDQIMRAAGFRMGPFELMDLIGIDVNYAATQSVFNAYYGEPRYRPHPIQAQMVAANRLGRKTGRGFYNTY